MTMPVMHGVFYAIKGVERLVTRNIFLLPCCMQTTCRKADMQSISALTVHFTSVLFTHPFASFLLPLFFEAMCPWVQPVALGRLC